MGAIVLKRSTPIFVDVDNLYIINNKVNVNVLKERIKLLKGTPGKKLWFGNTFTANLVRSSMIDIDIIDSKIETNSADHNIINKITTMQDKQIYLVSRDITLCRLAKFLNEDKHIKFMKISGKNLQQFDVDFNFKKKENLVKFLESLALYHHRFV